MKAILDFLFGSESPREEAKTLEAKPPKTYIAIDIKDGKEVFLPYYVRGNHVTYSKPIGDKLCTTEQEAQDVIDEFIKNRYWNYPKTIKYP